MQVTIPLVALLTVLLSVTPGTCLAQRVGPCEIRESEPGLLARATFPAARARLLAFGEFPGAQMVDAEIKLQDSRLVYVFDLKFSEHEKPEQVRIDAQTGVVVSVHYVVRRDNQGKVAVMGPSDLVSRVRAVYPTARSVADATVDDAKIVTCRLLVDQARTVFVFDLEVGDERALQQVLVDARTGVLIAAQQP